MHIVLVYRCYNDGTACYNLTFLHEKSLMTDLGLTAIRDDKVHLLGWYKLDTTALQR